LVQVDLAAVLQATELPDLQQLLVVDPLEL
jgi:hypothetical protein